MRPLTHASPSSFVADSKGTRLIVQPAPTRVLARLQSRLAHKFRTVELPLGLPWSGATYAVRYPATFDRLLTAAARDPEQNLPYWATLWPSGIALADMLLTQPHLLAGQRALELGCGLGVTATAALAVGAHLAVTDYAPESLLLCRINALRNIRREPHALRLNWREPSAAFNKLAEPPFPVVLAADVLYEARDVEPLLALIDRLVAPDGVLLLAEPGRPPAQRFVAAARMAGWHDEAVQHRGPWPDPEDAGVIVTLHTLRKKA